MDEATRAISSAMEGSNQAARWSAPLRTRIAEQLRFGSYQEELAILVEEDSSLSRTPDGHRFDSWSPPNPACVRVWERMLPTRPRPK